MENSIFEWGRAICYSGYRNGQSPSSKIYPSREQIMQDLTILVEDGFKYIRMYDPNPYAREVCSCIRQNGLPLKLMLGPGLVNEVNNPNCPWNKTVYTQEQLDERAARNRENVRQLAEIAREYRDVIFCVSVGNENTPDWGENNVPESSLIEFADYLREQTGLPVTFNEGALEWPNLTELARHLDIISVHSYPLWYGNSVDEAMDTTRTNYRNVCALYPDKPVLFSEVGWATVSNNAQMKSGQATEENQTRYCRELWEWTDAEKITAFVFEAFDEPWKGNSSPDEPEKHWGLYREDRSPKQAASELLGRH